MQNQDIEEKINFHVITCICTRNSYKIRKLKIAHKYAFYECI